MLHVCVSVVLFGECPHAMQILTALRQQSLDEGTNISLVLVDNGVSETVRAEIFESFGGAILLLKNRENLGFSAAVNQCVAEAIRYEADYLLLLNPDLKLDTVALREMLICAQKSETIGMVTPKLLRAQEDLTLSVPQRIDACGMIMTNSLRHLDRGSGQLAEGQFESEELVFGGTGACLLLKMNCIKDLALARGKHECSLWKIYPQLEPGANERPQLLDEAFFAYREDADLAFRAQIRGWQVAYCPSAIGHHVRRVIPERRAALPALINLWSVRNRFLLQLNNYKPWLLPKTILPGLIVRNFLVVVAVLFREWRSIPGLLHVFFLIFRAIQHRQKILEGSTSRHYKNLARWFQ